MELLAIGPRKTAHRVIERYDGRSTTGTHAGAPRGRNRNAELPSVGSVASAHDEATRLERIELARHAGRMLRRALGDASLCGRPFHDQTREYLEADDRGATVFQGRRDRRVRELAHAKEQLRELFCEFERVGTRSRRSHGPAHT